MRVHERGVDGPEGPWSPAAPVVEIEVCRCGRTHGAESPHQAPDWPLATAWTWLTTSSLDDADDDDATDADVEGDEEVDPAGLPWWDARSRPERRRALLPLVLLGELQAGVLLRALYEVLQGPAGPVA